MLSKNLIFNYFLVSILSGVFINNYFSKVHISFLVLLFFVILFLNFYIYIKKYLILLLVISFGFLLGLFISNHELKEVSSKDVFISSYYDNSKHKLSLEIKDVYKIEEFRSQYVAKILSIDGKKLEDDILGIISVPNNFSLKKGFIIETDAYLNEIENFGNFNYKFYLLSKNIYFKSYLNYLDIVDKKKLNPVDEALIKLRKKFLNIANKLYPEKEAVFLGGILFGARESLPVELKTKFNNSGLTHFIAVSGFNITILIVFFSFLFKYFPVFLRVILISVVIVLFTMLVGDTAPVIRASIMGLIAYYMLNFGRNGNTWTILILSLVVMTIFSPLALNRDISLHLSFLAVLGIIFTSDFFKKIFYFLPDFLAIKEAFVLTISAMVFSFPIIFFNFGQISLLAPLANIAVAWTIAFAMLFGFLSLMFYLISPVLGFLVGYIAFVFLRWDMLMVDLFGTIDWALLKSDVGDYKNYFILFYFCILAFIILYFRGENTKQAA